MLKGILFSRLLESFCGSCVRNVAEKSLVKNYHLVSLFSVVSKIFKKCVSNRLVDHLEKYSLSSDFHHGFRSSRSTGDPLTVISYRIAMAVSWSGVTRATALNIPKTFDKVCYAGLLHKLSSYGISGLVFGLFSSFLGLLICGNS